MNNNTLKEIAKLSSIFEITLRSYIGEYNDEISRAQITEELRLYISSIRELMPIAVDLGKVGLSKLTPHTHEEVVPNSYTAAIFKIIATTLSSD